MENVKKWFSIPNFPLTRNLTTKKLNFEIAKRNLTLFKHSLACTVAYHCTGELLNSRNIRFLSKFGFKINVLLENRFQLLEWKFVGQHPLKCLSERGNTNFSVNPLTNQRL